ncbi:phosphotransferase [Rhodococcus jostii]|uniref:phosphotransferase n=1 Tax=Rhodococcus jostii TaxID=132919 RepID=UPI003981E2C9
MCPSSRSIPRAPTTRCSGAEGRTYAVRDRVLARCFDTRAVERAWEAALDAPEGRTEAVWIHRDLQSGNLLTRHGRLTKVIDFGGLGLGDPACDCMVGWTLFRSAVAKSLP